MKAEGRRQKEESHLPGCHHAIRLRGPWAFEALERFAGSPDSQSQALLPLPVGGKVTAPADWGETLGADFLGRVRYTRHFNCPTNLEPGQRVWLAIDGVDHSADVALNGQPLGSFHAPQRFRAPVAQLLALHNVLVVVVSLAGDVFDDATARGDRAGQAGGLIGEVRLEIGEAL